MEFNHDNTIVQYCLQGMAMEEKGDPEEASRWFHKAWNEATDDYEKFMAAFYVARHQKTIPDKLKWLETVLHLSPKVNNETVRAALPLIYTGIAECYGELGDIDNAKKNHGLATSFTDKPSDSGPFYHGTKADLQIGDLLIPGRKSNYKSGLVMNHIYFTAMANGAGLAAALAKGDGEERVYIVQPIGSFENDPNVTNKKFPGNPTRSYRTQEPLKITGEISDWMRQTSDEIQQWKEKLANSQGDIIN